MKNIYAVIEELVEMEAFDKVSLETETDFGGDLDGYWVSIKVDGETATSSDKNNMDFKLEAYSSVDFEDAIKRLDAVCWCSIVDCCEGC